MQQNHREAAPHVAPGPFDDLFEESVTPTANASERGNSRDFSVWVSSRLDFFRAPSSAWPDDIGFSGFSAGNGAYRRLDLFWLAWLNSRVSALPLQHRPIALGLLTDAVNEAINAGSLPESLIDSDKWPQVVPVGYKPPVFHFSGDFVDI